MGGFQVMIAAPMLRIASRRSPALTRAMSKNSLDERGAANEAQFFAKREAEMLRKLQKHSPDADKPITPDYFVRKTAFKVSSLHAAADIDDIVIDDLVPLAKTMDGFLGLERHVCGKHLDYVLMSKWDSAANLVASGPGSAHYEMILSKLGDVTDTSNAATQNFMGDTDRFVNSIGICMQAHSFV